MHLVTPLMTGVRGAKNGSVFCYERGTEVPAPVWADASGKVRRYGALRLDALGSMGLYVDRLVDVTVRDMDGELVRAWTDGRADGAVVVESGAFTGVDDETGVSAVGERTTMAEAFDRLLPSAGTVDFNVLYGAIPRPVYMAIGDLAGAFFDPGDFGARGDDTGDDLGPIQAAIEVARQAGGGIVYLRAGTYRVSSTVGLYEEVSLVGAGAACTSLVLTDENVPLLAVFGGNTPGTARTHSVSGITFACELGGPLATAPLVQVVSGAAVVTDCYFDGTFNTGPLLAVGDAQRVRIMGSSFWAVAGTTTAVDTSLGTPQRVNVEGCLFEALEARTPGVGLIGSSRLHVDGCTFFNQNTDSINMECIVLSGNANALVDGCDVNSSPYPGTMTLLVTGALSDASEMIFEDCSLLDSPAANHLYAVTDPGAGGTYFSRLKTADARHAPLVQDMVAVNSNLDHPIIPDASQYGIHSVYNKSTVPAGAPNSMVIIGAADDSTYAGNVNAGRTLDVLYFCVIQESFQNAENICVNSVVPRWNFKPNSLFAFRMILSRAVAGDPFLTDVSPLAGEELTKLYCLSCSASPATVVAGEREGYGPI